MTQASERTGYEAIAELGRKIGIADLSTEDFDLIFADPHGVERFCDQFEAIDFTPEERFHFMQLIVASLDQAIEKGTPGCGSHEQRVERLLHRNLADYKYIIDYWGRTDTELHTVPMMTRLKRDPRYKYMGGDAPFEEATK